jgi:hypothetical protein
MQRRRVLAALAAAVATAGCGGQAGSDGDADTGDKSPTASPTARETATDTATDAPETTTGAGTDTGTPVEDPGAGGPPTHGPGERFVVEGDPSVAYTFHRFARADSLGPIGREPDQGTFLVAECTVETLGSGPIAVPVESILLRGGVRLVARQDDTDAASADDRVDLPPLTDETVFPNEPVRGVLVYDLPTTPGNDYYVQITPPDADGPEHRVPVGPVEDLPAL